MDLENCIFLRHHTTLEPLLRGGLKAMAEISTCMEYTSKDSSKITKRKVTVNLFRKIKGIHIVENGSPTCQMDPEHKNGQMEQTTLEPFTMEPNMGMED